MEASTLSCPFATRDTVAGLTLASLASCLNEAAFFNPDWRLFKKVFLGFDLHSVYTE
jgi:hypothetical protein